jgi:hypothetical protein
MSIRRTATLAAIAVASLLGACGGGGGDAGDGTGGVTPQSAGTLRLSLTDAPACGYDHAWVTVEKVRVHRSGGAEEGDSGWSEVVLAAPTRVDLLSLTNGTLLPLGQTELPAGTYTQMRLVLAPNSARDPLANAVQPTGGVPTALTTPSGQQSGLKANIKIDVAPGTVADFAIDFDACKSFVKAGKSGKILLKPVLAVIPIVSPAGQRVVGFVDSSLINSATTVSVQQGGVPVRATPPDSEGRFTLYPVLPGTYDLVITAAGRVNAVMTGVPVTDSTTTVIGSTAVRFNPPASRFSWKAYGAVTVNGSAAQSDGVVRALQSFTNGPTIEVGSTPVDDASGTYELVLPAGAPARTAYAQDLLAISFVADPARAGKYVLEATVPNLVPMTYAIDLTGDMLLPTFAFP